MSKIAFALDVAEKDEAKRFVKLLEPHVGAFKVGLEYFIANGSVPETSKPVILDLKLHDIPETVSRAVLAACLRGSHIRYITMHVQQKDTIRSALRVAEQFGVTLLGVTVLTSMTYRDIEEVDFPSKVNDSVTDRVLGKAQHGYAYGMRGFVCSPLEVKLLREYCGTSFLLVPGVRPLGSREDDQQRISTPGQAIQNGASMVVVGRPIRDASDPVAVAKQINEEITAATAG